MATPVSGHGPGFLLGDMACNETFSIPIAVEVTTENQLSRNNLALSYL